ncbi:transmembrane protein 65-like isoform X2 [Tubulanus polymorphus]|uniref:transmembrane protein 65-like isoform X2 n=1 Tax=Tubulanus polymorphus TaxID=672921 RepID=UPI003DA4BFEA
MRSTYQFAKICDVNLRTANRTMTVLPRQLTTTVFTSSNFGNRKATTSTSVIGDVSNCHLRWMGTFSSPPKGPAVTAKDDETWAKELIFNLTPRQRKSLYDEILMIKTVEDDKKAAKDPAKPLTTAQIKQLALFSGIPFIGFGTLDNIIMITAGEYIDTTFGAVLGISTMAAAAIGNMVSDVAGISTAGYVETLASKSGIKPPRLTPQQIDNKSTRIVSSLGRIIGVTIGCIIGMTPLLFFNRDEDNKDGKDHEKTMDDK